jgi:putative colanic acid biosynthesis acetyltransferase WcaF
MNDAAFKIHAIPSRYASPWRFNERLGLLLWTFAWPLFCAWTPKPFNPWRLLWLRIFGCKIDGYPFVHQHARIHSPWRLILHHRSSVGDRSNIYSLGEIELGRGCVVSQEAYLCTGTHDLNDPNQPLVTAEIRVGEDAFIGARAFIMAGVSIGDRAVVGACSVVTHNVEARSIVAGSPARFLRRRE